MTDGIKYKIFHFYELLDSLSKIISHSSIRIYVIESSCFYLLLPFNVAVIQLTLNTVALFSFNIQLVPISQSLFLCYLRHY